MSKCARCGSYEDERIIGGRYALVCRDNGHTVFFLPENGVMAIGKKGIHTLSSRKLSFYKIEDAL